MNLRVVLYAFPLALGAGAVIQAVVARRGGDGWTPSTRRGVLDAVTLGLLLIAGPWYVNHLHGAANPYWIPEGQDWREFLGLALELRNPGLGAPVANRYPFYPWLGVILAGFQGLPVYKGCMQVSIIAAGLIPAGLYFLGRQLAPAAIALPAAILGVHSRILLAMLGPPTDYLLYATLVVWTLGTGVWALRRGGWYRYLAFGVVLALLMASAAKALVVLTVAVPCAQAGLAWTSWHDSRRGLLEAVAFFAPLVIVWVIYGRLDLPLLPLERIVLTAQESVADERGYRVEFPVDLGWSVETPMHHGYWRVGDPEALRHLPDTYRFLLRGRRGNAPLIERLESVSHGLEREIPLSAPRYWWLVVPACLAAGVGRPGGREKARPPGVLVAGFTLAVVGVEFGGLLGNLYVPRYALDVVVIFPTLMVLGTAALFRLFGGRSSGRTGWAWWPAGAVILAWLVFGDGRLTRRDAGIFVAEQAAARVRSRYMDIERLERFPGNIFVVDLAGTHVLADVLPRALVYQVPDGVTRLTLPVSNLSYRFLVQPCQFAQVPDVSRWTTPDPDRLRRFGVCVDEDVQPRRPLVLIRRDRGRADSASRDDDRDRNRASSR